MRRHTARAHRGHLPRERASDGSIAYERLDERRQPAARNWHRVLDKKDRELAIRMRQRLVPCFAMIERAVRNAENGGARLTQSDESVVGRPRIDGDDLWPEFSILSRDGGQ